MEHVDRSNIDTKGLRDGAIDGIRRELAMVSDHIEEYIPDAVIIEKSKFIVEIDLGTQTIVHCDFHYLAE